jgi:hypothetical protein
MVSICRAGPDALTAELRRLRREIGRVSIDACYAAQELRNVRVGRLGGLESPTSSSSD